MKKNRAVLVFLLVLIVCGGAVFALNRVLRFRNVTYVGEKLWMDANFADFDRSYAHPERLIAIDVDQNNPYMTAVDGVLFSKDMTKLIKYPAARDAASYTVPEGVLTIADEAFIDCVKLRSVTLPEGLREIGTGAFRGCTSLEGISLPEGLTTLKREAFADCLLNSAVTIPAGLAQLGQPNPDDPLNMLGECVFSGSGATAFSVAPGNPAYVSVDGVLFDKEMTRLVQYPAGDPRATYDVPEGVSAIANEAFRNSRNLTGVSVPGSVKTIGRSAFEGCDSLREVLLAEGLQGVADRAFYGCPCLTDVAVPDSVTKVGRDAFGE